MNDICIICLSEDSEIGSIDELIRPCNCKSSLVHRSCLNQWTQFTGNVLGKKSCEICKANYILELDPNFECNLCSYKNLLIMVKMIRDVCIVLSWFIIYIFSFICYIVIFKQLNQCDNNCDQYVDVFSVICSYIVNGSWSFMIYWICSRKFFLYLSTQQIKLIEKLNKLSHVEHLNNIINTLESMQNSKNEICCKWYRLLMMVHRGLLPVCSYSRVMIIYLNVIVYRYVTDFHKEVYRIKNLNV